MTIGTTSGSSAAFTEVTNPLRVLLKKAGHVCSKKNWPRLTTEDFLKIGVKPTEFRRYCHQSTLHETLGPNFKAGFFWNDRPYSFHDSNWR